jgi:hypothetical protein
MKSPRPLEGLRHVWRRVYWWPSDRQVKKRLRGVRTVVAFGESLGDNLLCANVLAGLHAAGEGPLAMLTPYPELFAELPFPLLLQSFEPATVASLRRGGPRLVLPNYGVFDSVQDRHTPPPRDHLLVEMCRSAGLRGEIGLKPLFLLNSAERPLGHARASGHILVQSSSRGARIAAINKEWPQDAWEQVVSALRGRFPVTQIGSAEDPPLRGAADQRARLSLREVAACLAAACLFVGPEGFLMHLARAVDCRCVIVLGGRTAPHQTCYPENANLFTPLPCAPCWRRNTCEYDRECLRRISPADVLGAVDTQLALPPLSGPGQTVRL